MPTYRTDGAWGTGKGSNLTPAEVDGNFYGHDTRIMSLETNPPTANSVTSVTASGTALTFHLTDGSAVGPINIPVPVFRWRGEWTALTLYSALDAFTRAGSGVFLVLVDHTSAASFDPDALAAAITAGNFTVGQAYVIQTIGTTDFTLIGASANTVGLEFTATGAGSGTGTAAQHLYQLLLGVGANTELGELSDLAIVDAANNDLIAFDAGTSKWSNRTPTAATALLDVVVGDSGSGGTKGLVPAPAAGDAAANKFLNADGTWQAAATALDDLTDVNVPSPTDGQVLIFDQPSGDWVARDVPGISNTFGGLTDVSLTSLANGDGIKYDLGSGKWVNFVRAADGITQLTGDATAGPGSGSQAITLATVNGNVGIFTNPTLTVNAKGLITAISSGSAAVNSAALDTAFGSTRGSILVRGASGWAILTPGTTGQLLEAQGAGADPLWATVSGVSTTLAALTDVTIASPAASDFIAYDLPSSKWTNRSHAAATALLDAMVGDSGSGGTKGLAPAPAAGDAAAGKFLKANGTWAVPPGGGGAYAGYGSAWINAKTDHGAVGDGVTDDTAAIQAAIDAAAAAGGGVVYFPAGTYKVGGALQDTANANAQLTLPTVDAGTTAPIAITFIGEEAPYNSGSTVRTVDTFVGGSIIKSTLNVGAGGALLGGARSSGTALTNVHLQIRDMLFRMPDNPVLTGLNLALLATASLFNVSIDTGTYSDTGPTQPTTSSSFGVKMPQNNNGVENILDNVFVNGFYNNIRIGEHTHGEFVQSWFSLNGIVVPAANHASRVSHLVSVHSGRHLVSDGSGAAYIDIGLFDIEHAPVSAAAWLQTTYVVDDASNEIHGSCKYHTVLGGTGAVDTFQKNGGRNFVAQNQGTGAPARLQAQWVSGAIVANGTVYFVFSAPYAGTIDSLDYFTGAGSFTVAIEINGTAVTGLSAIAVSSATPSNASATAANTFSAGAKITGVITGTTGSPTDALLNLAVEFLR